MAASISADGDRRVLNKIWKERSQYMLDTGLYSDVKIHVKYSETGVKTFAVHSLYLKWASPVFERMLEGNFKESSKVIEFQHCPESFQALLTFIYLDQVDIQSSELAWDLYDFAHQYDIKRLDILCADYIEKNINAQTVWLAFERSKIYNLETIEILSRNFIVTNTTEMVSSEDFVHWEESTISFLLDQTALSIQESMLFSSIELWMKAEIKRKGGTEEKQEETKKSLIQRLLPKIHFFDMTYREILDGPNKSDFLSNEQKLSLFSNYLEKNSPEELNLAEGLSVFPKKRDCRKPKCASTKPLKEDKPKCDSTKSLKQDKPKCDSTKSLKQDNASLHSAEFQFGSYVQLPSCITINLQNELLSFNFKTRDSDCAFISTFDDDTSNEFWIGVVDGTLYVDIYERFKGRFEIQSYVYVNDNKMHSVSFKFRPYAVDMILDNHTETHTYHRVFRNTVGSLRIGKNVDFDEDGFSGYISSIFISSINRMVNFRTDPEKSSYVVYK